MFVWNSQLYIMPQIDTIVELYNARNAWLPNNFRNKLGHLQEVKVLLRIIPWSVSEISYALGFAQPAHLSNFFRKHAALSLLKFRHV